MPTAGRPESGFLVLADISGFTAFVTATELEHGAEVTGALLAGVMEALSPPMEIQELEGDAVFALGPDHAQGADRRLLESFGRAFAAFSERRREISLDTSCACRACRGVLGLSLLYNRYGTDFGGLMAMATLSLIPVLVVFFVAQRNFVQGVVVSGVKG